MTAVILVALLVGAYFVAILEAWAATGRFRPAGPLTAAAALLGQESIVPRLSDRLLFEAAPPLLLMAATLSFSVLPLARGAAIINLATGALFVNAALAYVMVAVVMAGWGADSAYTMIGGWRFLGQLVAYAMLIVMPITAVAMRAQSLVTATIVGSQSALWNALAQPLGFALFFLAAMAVAFLTPFDLPVGQDIAGGAFEEYTGWRLAVVRLARLVLVVSLAAAVTVFYLGGWLGPILPGWSWAAIKMLAVVAIMVVGGRYLPRVRNEHLLEWTWKLGVPLALVNIFWVGVTLLLVAQ